ncbi:hypothetical protein [Mesorhizobium humile]|uniref:Uncharacterized protein n=1 Tax=Mesorhizobium humile TaxID=3072313 RepID=A0ABU4YR80_9HYPH|nr:MULTISPECIES: hypothetical protein [unclassified Mesorhizobium]MDX8462828.1 hypothetical protein [Mesorhizobium sp. VK2D]MDX8489493.1 hypothetical protein [Mesorhizobium sp. VK2B]
MKAQHSSIGHELTSSNVAGAIFAHPRRQTSAISPGLGAAVLSGRQPWKPMRHVGAKMQIWRRNFLSMFLARAQFGGSLRGDCRQKMQ